MKRDELIELAEILHGIVGKRIVDYRAGDERAAKMLLGFVRGVVGTARDVESAQSKVTAIAFREVRRTRKRLGASDADAVAELRYGSFGWLDRVSDSAILSALAARDQLDGFALLLDARGARVSRERIRQLFPRSRKG
jgi:hypothetical protein